MTTVRSSRQHRSDRGFLVSLVWAIALVVPLACIDQPPPEALDLSVVPDGGYWSKDDGPDYGGVCMSDADCDRGYSCIVAIETCVRDGTLQEGDVCTDAVQCFSTLVCPPDTKRCSTRCTNYFQSADPCDSISMCMPVLDPELNVFLNYGACQVAQCPHDLCLGGDVCIELEPGLGYCMVPCAYWISSGDYRDNIIRGTCQPMGASETLVSWPPGIRSEGAICDLVDKRCDEELICVYLTGTSAQCHRLCDFDSLDDGCANTATTCTQASTYDYCAWE